MTQSRHFIALTEFGDAASLACDASAAFGKAADYARQHPGTTLVVPPGRYRLRHPDAVTLENAVMQGAMGPDPEKKIFTPHYPYVKGVDLSNTRDLTIEAAGATIATEGWMEPVSVIDARGLSLKGVTMTCERTPYTQGRVTESDGSEFVFEYEPVRALSSGTPVPRMLFWNKDRHELLGRQTYARSTETLAPGKLLIKGECPDEARGLNAIATHSFHFRPAILIQDACDISLKNVTIHAHPGMGVLTHRSQNILFDQLHVIPEGDSFVSTNTDATHVTSCAGDLVYRDCVFRGNGDDSLNVHNYYHTPIDTVAECCYRVSVRAPTHTHAQVLDYADVGDRLEVVERRTLAPVSTRSVVATSHAPERWSSDITLDAPLPHPLDEFFLSNITRLPRTRITGCSMSHHRARGCLIKSRDVLIENCRFHGLTSTAIHVGAEAYWHESTISSDVTLRGNTVTHCGYGGSQNNSDGIAVNVQAEDTSVPGLHQNLVIEGNDIEAVPGHVGIAVHSARNMTLRDNTIRGTDTPIKTSGIIDSAQRDRPC